MAMLHLFVPIFVFTAAAKALTDDHGLTYVFPQRDQHDFLYHKYREELYGNDHREEQLITGTCLGRNCHVRAHPCSLIVPRTDWHALNTKHSTVIANPVSHVFIHHTVMDRCTKPGDCIQAMQKVQEFHVHIRKWDDVGYSFVVGEDGRAYEGRGYSRVGAHTLGWNNVSIAIAVMGDFSDDLPNGPALEAINNVIESGIMLGKIMPDYKLHGHCDARPMFESPGKKFYKLIQTWPHYEYIPIEKLKL